MEPIAPPSDGSSTFHKRSQACLAQRALLSRFSVWVHMRLHGHRQLIVLVHTVFGFGSVAARARARARARSQARALLLLLLLLLQRLGNLHMGASVLYLHRLGNIM